MTAAARTLIGVAALAGGLAAWSSPANDAPRFTCPANAECTFTGDHLNGPVPLTIPVGGHGLQPGAPWDPLDGKGAHAGSLRNRWSGDTWVKNRQAGRVKCIRAGGWASLGHNYGVAVTLSAGNSRGCREHAPGFGPDMPLTPGGLGGLNPGGCNHADTVMETCLPVGPFGRRS